MSATQVDKIVEIYRALAKFPTPSSAKILNGKNNQINFSVVSTWSQRNLECGKLTKFQQFHQVDLCSGRSTNLMPVDSTNVLLSCLSHSNEFNAVLREASGDASNGSKKQYLEIWKVSNLWKNFDLSALEVHGDVYTDGEFHSFDWSPCGEKLLYVAERKYQKSEPFYKIKPQEKKENGTGDSKIVKGNEHLFRQDWGEQLLGKSETVVALCNIETDSISVLDGIPDHFCPGQVAWAPDGKGIVGVVWKTTPRRLGLVYCSNRESYIFHLTDNGVFTILSEEGRSVRSPRFSPDGECLAWLERATGGPHNCAHQLVCFMWKTKEKRIIIDTVNQELEIKGGVPFYGLYNLALPRRCWDESSREIVFSTPQKYAINSYVVDMDTKCISPVECDEGSLTVLDVWSDIVVCSKSSFNKPPVLLLATLKNLIKREGREQAAPWVQLSETEDASLLEGLAYHYLSLTQEEQGAACSSFCAMYLEPGAKGPSSDLPLVVLPHGGPHSQSVNTFFLHLALFNLLGFGVLLINYRGSTGAGQDSINSLPGHIGEVDVQDVRLATKDVLEKFPAVSARKVVLYGGSHGGFLVTYLSGKYPSDYKAVVAANPVVDVTPMFSISDIPDWACVETGLPYDISGQISCEALEQMKKCSPMNHCSPSSPPTLLLIGKKDARVPGSQGTNLHYALKAHNVKTKLFLYEDNHSLSQVPVEMDALINSILWFLEHL